MAIRHVAAVGEAAPGTESGTVFSSLAPWGLSTNGRAVFTATLTGPSIAILSNDMGVWRHDLTTNTLLGRAGSSAPGTPGYFTSPGLNLGQSFSRQGEQAVNWQATGPGVASTNDFGLWSAAAGSNAMRLVAREGDVAPGTGGLSWNNFGGYNDAGQPAGEYRFGVNNGRIVFHGTTRTPARQGIWIDHGGLLSAIAVETGPPPGLDPDDEFGALSLPRITSSGLVYFHALLVPGTNSSITVSNDASIWSWSGGLPSLVVREGQAAPGGGVFAEPGGASVNFRHLAANSAGQICFVGTVTGTPAAAGAHRGIFAGPPGSLSLIAEESAPAPGTPAGVAFGTNNQSFVHRPVLLNNGDVVFRASLTGASVNANNDAGLWLSRSGTVHLLVREGDPAPGFCSDCTFTVRVVNAFTANNRGQVAFLGRVTNGVALPELDAIFAQNETGEWNVVAFAGGTLEIRPGYAGLVTDLSIPGELSFSGIETGSRTTGEDGQPSCFSDHGELLFRALFSSASGGPQLSGLYAARISTGGQARTAANFLNSADATPRVNAFTGELMLDEAADLFLAGPLSVFFSRYYASGLQRDGRHPGRLGANWLHDYEWRLNFLATNRVEAVTRAGRAMQFAGGGTNWTLTSARDIPYQLTWLAAATNFVLGHPHAHFQYFFDCLGRLTRIEDLNANRITLRYRPFDPILLNTLPAGLLTNATDGLPGGRTLSFEYNTNGQLVTVSDSSRRIGFGYDTRFELASITNANTNTATYGYDSNHVFVGLITNVMQPLGNVPWSWTWSPSGTVASERSGDTQTWTFVAQQGTTLATLTDPLGNQRRFSHDTNGNLTIFRDELGKSIFYSYNSNGQRSVVLDREGDSTRMGYHGHSGLLQVWTHADGTVVSNSFIPTPTNNLTFHFINQTRAADGTTRQFGRDGSGNLTNYVDALTNVWRYQYGAGGLLTNAINPTGGVTRFTYTPSRDLTNRLDAATNFTRWSRDVFHRVVVVSNADGSRTFFQFDANDNLTNILTPRTNAYGFGYDANNRIETSVDPLGRAFTNRWDHMDRLADQYDAQGNPVHVDFDPLGRVRRVRDPNQIEISVSYDKALRVASWTNEIGVAWRIEYDAEGVPKMVIDPIGRTNVTHTDTMGRPTNIVYAMTNDLGFRYDGLGRVTQLKDELGLRNHRHHDAAGNLTNNLLADGFLGSRYEFDSLHRPTNAVDPRGNAHASRWDSMGRRISDTDPLGRVTVYEYDRQNRISRIVFPGGLGSQTNTYDAEGNPVRGLFSDGTDLQFGWDAAGRLASANGLALAYSPIDRITNCNGLAMTYDAGGRMTSLTFAPGRTLTYAYDPRGLVTNIGDWAVGNVRFGYDTVGRLVSIERPNGITTTNQYDAMNRLVFIQDGSLAAGVLTRDAAGRILSNNFTRPLQAPLFGLSLTNSYDAANQIAGAQYDALGRVTNDGSRVYRWDLAGRLSQLVQGTQTNVYTYDALRQRLTRTAGGMSRSYVWNYAFPAPVLSVERESGNDLRYFIHLPDGSLVYSVETNNARRFYHYDETGSTLFLTDDSGNIVRAYDYDAFGRPLAASGTVENAFTWQGRNGVMQEGTNALYYQRARYYEAERGRWLSPDLVRARGPRGLNTYQYGWNNPLNFVDRTGRDPEPVDDFAREKKSIAELRERMEAAADPADRKRFAELLKDQMRALEEATSQRPLAAVTPEQLAEQARRVSELHARMVSARDPRERRLQTVIFQEQAALLATYVRIYEPASPSKASRREALLREKEHLDDMIRDASGDARGHAADARARATATDFVQAIFDFGSSYANRQARHESKARDYRQDVDHLTRQRAHVEAALGQLETTGNPSVLQYTETSEPEGATP